MVDLQISHSFDLIGQMCWHKGLWLILINWTAQLFAVVSHTEIVTGYETENKKSMNEIFTCNPL